MRRDFEEWMKRYERKKPNTAYQYAVSIDKISRHYSENTNKKIDLFKISDPDQVRPICEDYALSGKFASFGGNGNGTMRNAIATYLRYINNQNVGASLSNVNSEQSGFISGEFESSEDEEIDEFNNFTYERDLQNSLITEIPRLFEGYKIYGDGLEGVEYSIDGKRIDVLLEHKELDDLLIIELKAGIADYKVFGQMSMYIGMLSKKYPRKNISGLIIAGEIDESLRSACAITKQVSLKTYKMKLELENA